MAPNVTIQKYNFYSPMHRRQFLSLLPAVPLLGARSSTPLASQCLSDATIGEVSTPGARLRYHRQGSGRSVIVVGSEPGAQGLSPAANIAFPYQKVIYERCSNGASRPAQDLHHLMMGLNLSRAVLLSDANNASTVFDYLNQFGSERVAGLLFSPFSRPMLPPHRSALAKLGIPTLLTYSGQDMMLPLSAKAAVNSSLPHVELKVLQNGEHSFYPQPQFNTEIERFVSRL
ncbi:MAG: hypothetical protein AAFU71_19185 [Cyanobacteria bacterium J06632_22]